MSRRLTPTERIDVPSYLVEAYMPRSQADEAHAAGMRARDTAVAMTREGSAVRYVRTTFLPDDETCFHLFEASSAEAVEEVSRRARLGRARVVRAVEASRPARPKENKHAQVNDDCVRRVPHDEVDRVLPAGDPVVDEGAW